jgi:O-antigen ligase
MNDNEAIIDKYRWPFNLVLLYLLFEFGRPQGIFPALNVLHLPALVSILLILYLIRIGKISFSDPQTKLYLLLIFFMVSHIPIALNNYWAFNVWRTMVLLFFVYLCIISFVNTSEKFYKLINYWIYIHIFLAIFGIAKGGRGIGGFLGDENDFCMTINMAIPFSYYMAMGENTLSKKLFYIGVTCIFVFANIISFSRGGFVGLIGVGIYIWIKSPGKVKNALFIAMMALFIVLAAPEKFGDSVSSITEEGSQSGTGRERVYTWGIAWDMFKGNPLFGVGQGNAPWEFRKYEIAAGFEEGLLGRSRAGRAMHSIYFTMLPELGLFGTFLIGFMIYYSFKDTKRIRDKLQNKEKTLKENATIKNRNLAFSMEASLIGYLVSSIFISTLYYPNFWILMGFIVCFRRMVCEENEKYPASH